MFRAIAHQPSSELYQCKFLRDDIALTYGEMIGFLKGDRRFREFFGETLRQIPFAAYRWETPALSLQTLDQAFEFTAIASPDLDRSPQRKYFESYFQGTSQPVVSFLNLGGDAVLVVPTPQDVNEHYVHLGVFMAQAPYSQQDELWQQVGQVIQSKMSDQPLWLSTAGGGVAWLHVRLDRMPKYYRYRPYTA